MKFSLVICTYMRPKPLVKLLNSVSTQTLYPNEILIIDGSTNSATKDIINAVEYQNLKYFAVSDEHRGLTKQRNYGILKVSNDSEVVCFLDDDTELDAHYFEEIIKAFKSNKEIVGVGGVAVNENRWAKASPNINYSKKKYYFSGDYVVKEGLRNVVRNYLGLESPYPSGILPSFSHGRTCGYPLNGEIHEVDLLIGMSFSFKKSVVDKIKFSNYFEGYGLYEDADFSLRALAYGKNVICTSAKLNHYHDEAGRPNKFKYGKMVIRNGWYVWRIKNPKPSFKDSFKWHLINFIQMKIRLLNVINTNKRKEALTDALGRIVGWFSLLFNKPQILDK